MAFNVFAGLTLGLWLVLLVLIKGNLIAMDGFGVAAAAPALDSQGWTQETTGSRTTGPWLEYSPAGTRYYRNAEGTIYRLYPPGVQPNAEPANPFGLSDSTSEVPK
jgi:hypothetical protein